MDSTYKVCLHPHVFNPHHRPLLVASVHDPHLAVARRPPFRRRTPRVVGVVVRLEGDAAPAFRGRTQVGSDGGLGASGRIATLSRGVAIGEKRFENR